MADQKENTAQQQSSTSKEARSASTSKKDLEVLRRFEKWEAQHRAGKMSIDIR